MAHAWKLGLAGLRARGLAVASGSGWAGGSGWALAQRNMGAALSE